MFSCCCYLKPFPGVHLVERSEMVHGMITGAECKKKKKKGKREKFGSGQVNTVFT